MPKQLSLNVGASNNKCRSILLHQLSKVIGLLIVSVIVFTCQTKGLKAALPPQLGTKKILVMLVDFPDLPNSAPPVSGASNAMLSVDTFFRSNSFNQLSITSTVVGTLRMPSPSSTYVTSFNVSGLRNDAIAAVRARGYDPTNFDYDIITFTNIGYWFYGWGTFGTRGLWIQNYPGFPFTDGVVNHELGHNFGLSHAHAWISPTGIGPGTSSEGGNPFDTMGGGASHYNSNFKSLLGWIPQSCIQTATASGVYRIYVEDGCGNLRLDRKYSLVIPAGVTTPGEPEDYWVESRQLINNSTVRNGVLVMWVNPASTTGCYLLDSTPGSQSGGADASDSAVTIGRSFTDPNMKITVAPVGKGGTGADTYFDVQVTLNSIAVPPAVAIPPTNQVLAAGANGFVSVSGISSSPIFYQWYRYGLPVLGATSASLSILNASAAQAGDYSVSLSNALGSVISSTATLSVHYPPGPSCYPLPNGIMAWWTGDGHPLDWVGTNHAALQGSVGYSPGVVNQGFSLNGTTDFLQVPNTPAWPHGTNAFTIDLWVNFSAAGTGRTLVGHNNGPGQVDKWMFWLNDQQLRFYAVNAGGGSDNVGNARFLPATNQWYHLAVTRSGTTFTFYINGGSVSTNSSIVSVPAATAPLTIGAAEGSGFVPGLMDDIRIYNRTLSASEILGIYTAGTAGMCSPPNPPALLEFTTAAVALNRGVGNVNFVVSRVANIDSVVTVNYATSNGTAIAGLDYTAVAGSVTFNSGESNKTIGVGILNHSASGERRQFSLNLFGASTNAVIGATSTATVTIAGCLPPPAGLVAWWNADGQVDDLAGYNSGTLHGGATFVPGKVGQAVSLDGIDDYIEIPNSDTFNFGPTSPMSISLWAYRTGPATIMHIIGKRVGCSGSGISYQMAFDSAGMLFGGDNGWVYTGRQMPTNVWIHLAATFDGTTFCFYTNGLLVATGLGTLGPVNSAPLRIGKLGECGGTFDGWLDEVSIYNRALSATEIQDIYAADTNGLCLPKPPMFTAPLAYNQSNGFAVSATVKNGKSYRIQANTNLAMSNWLTLTNFTGSTATVFRFVDTAVTNLPRKFYRIVSP